MSIIDALAQKSAELSRQNRRKQQLTQLTEQLAENLRQDGETLGLSAQRLAEIQGALRALLRRLYDPARDVQAENAPVDGSAAAFLSEDRMTAYVCLLPPVEDGRKPDENAVRAALEKAGVTFGVLEDAIREMLEKEDCLRLLTAACGQGAVDGVMGALSETYPRLRPVELRISDGEEIDFNAALFQPVRKGETLCALRPTTPGIPGSDVLGTVLPCQEAEAVALPAGVHTQVSDDGLTLLAETDGLLVEEEGRLCVRPIRLLGPQENVEGFSGDLFIEGDVTKERKISAAGNIIVQGAVRGAEITSTAGLIRVLGGVRGGRLSAAGQLQAPMIVGAEARAGELLYAGELRDSQAVSGDVVRVLSGTGIITGGSVTAKTEISCVELGINGVTSVTVGYTPELSEALRTVNGELEELQETLEKLRKNINGLRMGGDTLSLEKRALLATLVEQRDLYTEKEKEVNQKIKAIQEQLGAARGGKIYCEKLNPVVKVQIGDCGGTLRYPEKNCTIHVYAGQIVSK